MPRVQSNMLLLKSRYSADHSVGLPCFVQTATQVRRAPPSTVVKLNAPLVLLLRLTGPLLMYGTGRLQLRLVTPDQAGL